MAANVVKKCSCGQEEPSIFSIGQRFYFDGFSDEYILCRSATYNTVQLTNLETGSIFTSSLVVDHIKNIKPEEFSVLTKNNKLVCSKCKTRYNIVEETYCAGQRFIYPEDNEEYILADIHGNVMSLINLVNGNRWSEGVKVEDKYNITQKEFESIATYTGKNFKLKE